MERIIAAFSGIDGYLAVAVAGWAAVLLACFVDLWDAVATAKILEEPVRSRKVRKTIEKFGEYWRPQVMCLLADIILFPMSWYEMPWASIGLSLVEIGIELRSVYEHQRKRKSRSSQVPKLIGQIVEAATEKDAKNVLKALMDIINDSNDETKLQKRL